MRVAVVGCGLIGRRRAAQVAADPRTELVSVVDSSTAAATALAAELGVIAHTNWMDVAADPAIDAVIAATPNAFLSDIAIAALEHGKHVLVEKPMGRNLTEARAMAEAAKSAGRVLKIGFNHRYHPALRRAHELFVEGEIGEVINIRARYGHGGRPGYEREWRGNPELAGGGELTDQGVHVADLIHWFAGVPTEAVAFTQNAIWPIPLEDNAFGLFRFKSGAIAQFHTSWTQWKNLFSFEVFGTKGSLEIDGLGGSYGIEHLTIAVRKPEGGAPNLREELFDQPDDSWKLEWDDFVSAALENTPYWGTPADGLAAMRMLDALYSSAKSSRPIKSIE